MARSTKKLDLTKETFTTHEVAIICFSNISNIQSWVRKNYIRGVHRTPGGHHRISREGLLEFIKKFKLPSLFNKSFGVTLLEEEDAEGDTTQCD